MSVAPATLPTAPGSAQGSLSSVDMDAWQSILSAYQDTKAAIDQALAGPPADLGALAANVQRRLDALRRRLPGGQEAVIVPIAFLLDERVLASLGSTEQELAWPLLGRSIAGTDFGGDVFFQRADDLRAQAAPPALVVQVYLFCLDEGFSGRYADDPEALADYRAQLFAKLSAAVPPGTSPAPKALPTGPRPLWQLVLAAAAVVLIGWVVMVVVAGRM